VNLARNQLRWLPRALLPLAALNSLSLAGNQLSSSASSSSEEEDDGEEDTTKKKEATFFSSLEHLDLSRNFLGKVPGRWLSAAANLRVLNLARNQIAELRPGQLANLSRIYEVHTSTCIYLTYNKGGLIFCDDLTS
jgi:Leucine-rich repeat (LRR) protein